jgi:hypothetical protein
MKINLQSGAVLDITLLPYEESWDISQRITKVLETIDIDIKAIDFKNPSYSDVIGFKGPLFNILSSKEVLEAAKICLARCTYNGLKIDSMTFEVRESRKDFLPVMYHVLKENISPFFEGLISFLSKS